MRGFQKWYRENGTRLSVASREDLALAAYTAGIEEMQEPETLLFNGKEITNYKTATVLTIQNNAGFDIDLSGNEDQEISQESLQVKLNTTCSVDIVEWLQASKEKLCVLEISRGDVIDFSAVSTKEGVTESERAFLAVLQADSKFILVTEIKVNDD